MLNSKIYKTETLKSRFLSEKKTITTILMLALIGLSHVTNAQSPNWLWAKGMNGTGNDIGYSVTTDAFGNVYTTGFFSGTVDFDPDLSGSFNLTSAGVRDIFILKLDSSGNFVWAKALGGASEEFGLSIAFDPAGSGAVYTTGFFEGTGDFDPGAGVFNLTPAGPMAVFISKLDTAGNFIWAKQFTGTNGVKANGQSITIDASGSVYTTGHFQGTYDFNPGAGAFNLYSSQRGIFISKLDSSGNFVWAKRMSGTYDAYGNSIALDVLGNIYTTGSFTTTVDFDPGAGTFNLTAPGSTPFNGTPPADIFISKLDNAGNFLWAKQMGGTSDDYAMSITIDHAGSGAIYTTGSFRLTADFDPGAGVFNLIGPTGGPQFPASDIFVSKLDTSGNFVWAKHLGENSGERGYSIATDNLGNVYSTGTFVGTADFDPGAGTFSLISAGGQDVFISKLNSSGNFVFAKAAGGTGYDYGRSIAVDASGNVHVFGDFRGASIMFDSTTLTNAQTNVPEIFIAKLDATVVTGTNEIENFDYRILLFPNPAATHLTIALGSNNKKVEVTIADITGKVIYKTSATDIQKLEVNTSEFAAGIYVVQIQTADFIATKKLVVEK